MKFIIVKVITFFLSIFLCLILSFGFEPIERKIDCGSGFIIINPSELTITDSGLVFLNSNTIILKSDTSYSEAIKINQVVYKIVVVNNLEFELTAYNINTGSVSYCVNCIKPNDSTYLFHGKYISYNSNGFTLLNSGYYYNGFMSGIWFWYSDNTKNVMFTYEKGILEGEYWKKYKNGNFMFMGKYHNGNPSDLWENYFENGQIESAGNYSLSPKIIYESPNVTDSLIKENKYDGVSFPLIVNIKIGKWRYWNETGLLLKTEHYDMNGKLLKVDKG